jgi:hypothetical protein
MQKYFDDFSFVGADTDGYKTKEGHWDLMGEGLVGLNWNKEFIRPAPVHIEKGLIHTYRNSGSAWVIMSAGGVYKNANGRSPAYDDWKHVALEGMSPADLKEWQQLIDRKHGQGFSDYIDYDNFSYPIGDVSRKPLGELVAIKRTMYFLFGG